MPALEVPCRPAPERRLVDAEEDGVFFFLLLPLLLRVARAAQRQGRARRDAGRPRTRSAGIVINDGGRASSSAPPRFVRPKAEPGLPAVKTEPRLAAVKTEPGLSDEAALKWGHEDWERTELERQCRAL